MSDIKAAVEYNSLDLARLIKYGDINKWSFHKPVRYNSLHQLSAAQIASVHCGLSPVSLSKLLRMSIGYNGSSYSDTEIQCRAEVAEWPYNRPRGKTYNEWFRMLDFAGYNGKAIAPDGGWTQMVLSTADIAKMASISMTVDSIGDYTGYNFKLTPKYNGATCGDFLYSLFSMRFGDASGESIGTVTDMDIPIKYVTALTGNWRIALAIWIPNFGSNGGWGIFAGRLTISQALVNLNTNISWCFPDLATNPFAAQCMQSYISAQGGYATFDAVPILVKDLGYTYSGTVFTLRAVDGVTTAYCMPSGTDIVPIVCGTPPVPVYYSVSYELVSGVIRGYLTNTDTNASHTFGYTITVRRNGEITSQSSGTATLSAGETRQVGGAASGMSLEIQVTSQDGTPV